MMSSYKKDTDCFIEFSTNDGLLGFAWKFKEILCEDHTILWISKLCSFVSIRWCFIELV